MGGSYSDERVEFYSLIGHTSLETRFVCNYGFWTDWAASGERFETAPNNSTGAKQRSNTIVINMIQFKCS